ncbi:MAG: LuxR C-terminal-related transcriptional regulator [Solirubrobacteraceae bacterium]
MRRLIADALATLIGRMDGLAVAGVAVTEKALDTIVARRPALLVVGVGTDSPEALSLVRAVRSRAPDLKVVMVVDAIEPAVVRFALEQGVSGLLLSDAPAREIAASLRQVLGGHAVLPAGWQRMISADADADEAVRSLSERQREVLDLVADGCSYEEIAGRLFISANTVKSHVRSIYAQLGVHNRMAAAHLLAHERS